MIKTFHCYVCKKRKSAKLFNKNKSRSSGLSSRCIKCQRIVERKYYKTRNQVKVKARLKVNNEILKGKIIRKPCVVCGSVKKVEGHHEDYSKALEVIWLCQKHHHEHHQRVIEKNRQS